METIELKLVLDRNQFEAIVCGLKALTAALSNTYNNTNTSKETNTPTNANTQYDYKSRVDNLISSLASNTRLDTKTNQDTLTRITAPTTINKNNNIIVNDVVDEKAINISPNTSKDTNTCKDVEIPTLEDVEAYVRKCGYDMSSQKFFDYYSRNGWKTKTGVSLRGVWKGFVDSWAKSEFARPKPQTPAPTTIEEKHAAHPFVPSFQT